MKPLHRFLLTAAVALSIWAADLAHGAQAKSLTAAPEGSFSIVVIPDTQQYRGRGSKSNPDSTDEVTNPVFDAHTRWIAANLVAQRIVFVSHVGDIVDRNVPAQWQVARGAMDRLHGRVPYGISVGNHDMTTDGDSTLFQRFFPADRFASFDWYGGHYAGNPERPAVSANNANSFQLFSAEGLDFIVLHLECNAPDDVLAWANQVLAQHTDRIAIITTHMDLGPVHKPRTNEGFHDAPKGRMQWSKIHRERANTPAQMWDKCYRRHAHLQLIFSGDQSRTTAMYLPATGDHGNTVHALLSDYTSSGPLRIYRFRPAENTIDVITFDTTNEELVESTRNVPDRQQNQFSIRVDLSQ